MANSSRQNKLPSPAQSSSYTLFPPAETKRSDDAGMDIPEGANLEASLKAGEELFRASVEALLDGFAIFTSIRDNHDRIIDFRYEYINDAGCRLNQRSREDLVGHTLLELFPAQKDLGLIEAYAQVVETGEPLIRENLVYEDVFGNGQRMTRVFDLRTGKLGDGFVVAWRDVTEKKRIEESEREQRTMAEALRDTAAILNGTLRIDEVLDQILTQMGRVLPYDTANLMLLEDGMARIVRYQGYKERGLEDVVLTHRLSLEKANNLKWMAETGKPQAIPDTWQSSDWIRLPRSNWIRSYAGAPLQVRGRTIGFLNVNSASQGLYTDKHAGRLQVFAEHAALAIENARLYHEVEQLALTDEVTGLLNRRGLNELGRRELERAARYGSSLSAMMLDIDHFKDVNDSFSHAAGDQVLQFLGKLFLKSLRTSDIVSRYGGEEFLILLPETKLSSAAWVAERLRKLVSANPIPTSEGNICITVSLGVATMSHETEELADLVKKVDAALYQAKQSGRNRIVVQKASLSA